MKLSTLQDLLNGEMTVAKWIFLLLIAVSCRTTQVRGVIVSRKFVERLEEKNNMDTALRTTQDDAWGVTDINSLLLGSGNGFCHVRNLREKITDLLNIAGNCLQEMIFDDCCQPQLLQLRRSGIYPITNSKGGHGYCDMTTDGGGWLVVSRREGRRKSFHRTWKQFKRGFGPLDRDFWIGNDALFQLTNLPGGTEMRIDLKHKNGSTFHAHYDQFHVGPERENYVLSVGGYNAEKSNIWDAFSIHDGLPFSTKDRDNTIPYPSLPSSLCLNDTNGGWWYLNLPGPCFHVNFNAYYYIPSYYFTSRRMPVPEEPEARGIPFYYIAPDHSLVIEELFASVEMKIRPRVWHCGLFELLPWERVQYLLMGMGGGGDKGEEKSVMEEQAPTPGPSSTSTLPPTPSP